MKRLGGVGGDDGQSERGTEAAGGNDVAGKVWSIGVDGMRLENV